MTIDHYQKHSRVFKRENTDTVDYADNEDLDTMLNKRLAKEYLLTTTIFQDR